MVFTEVISTLRNLLYIFMCSANTYENVISQTPNFNKKLCFSRILLLFSFITIFIDLINYGSSTNTC